MHFCDSITRAVETVAMETKRIPASDAETSMVQRSVSLRTQTTTGVERRAILRGSLAHVRA